MKKWTVFELSLLIAAAVTLLCCAFYPAPTALWWSTAFEPLCDGLALGNGAEGIVLRSRLWEWMGMLLGR